MTEKTLKLYYVPFSYKVPFINILTQKKNKKNKLRMLSL